MKCKKCGYVLNGDEKFCPNCGSSIRKKRKKRFLLFPLLIVIVGAIIMVGYVRNQNLNEVIEISAKELLKEDTIDQYKRNPLVIHGYLYSDYDGKYYMTGSENSKDTTLQIFYDSKVLNNELGSGSSITVKGKLDDKDSYSMHCSSLKVDKKIERNHEFTDVKQLINVIKKYEDIKINVQGFLKANEDNHIYLTNEDESANIDIPNLDLETFEAYADQYGTMAEVEGFIRKKDDTYVLEYEKLNQNEYTKKINEENKKAEDAENTEDADDALDDEYFTSQFEVWNIAENPERFNGKKVMVIGVLGANMQQLPSGGMSITLSSSLDPSKYIILEGNEVYRMPSMSRVDCYGEIYYENNEIHMIVESFIGA